MAWSYVAMLVYVAAALSALPRGARPAALLVHSRIGLALGGVAIVACAVAGALGVLRRPVHCDFCFSTCAAVLWPGSPSVQTRIMEMASSLQMEWTPQRWTPAGAGSLAAVRPSAPVSLAHLSSGWDELVHGAHTALTAVPQQRPCVRDAIGISVSAC